MRTAAWLLCSVALTACGAELTVLPEAIDWGEVDFNQPVPTTGHEPVELTLRNTGSGDLEVVFLDLDDERLNLGGQLDSVEPPRLTLAKGDVAVLTLGVAGYEPGETGTEVDGELRLAAGRLRDDVILPWSYVPTRSDD